MRKFRLLSEPAEHCGNYLALCLLKVARFLSQYVVGIVKRNRPRYAALNSPVRHGKPYPRQTVYLLYVLVNLRLNETGRVGGRTYVGRQQARLGVKARHIGAAQTLHIHIPRPRKKGEALLVKKLIQQGRQIVDFLTNRSDVLQRRNARQSVDEGALIEDRNHRNTPNWMRLPLMPVRIQKLPSSSRRNQRCRVQMR